MGLQWQKPGINHVGEYQAAGHVLVITGSSTNHTIYLKYVASSITATAHNTTNNTITFFDSSHAALPFEISNGTAVRFTGKFLTFKVGENCDALVEITNIPSASYSPPSGSMLHRTQNDVFRT